MCIVVPAKQGQSQDTARQLYAMWKKMVVLPMLARRTGTRYRESEGGRKRAEGVGKRGDIVGWWWWWELVGAQGVLSAQRLVEVGASGAKNSCISGFF